MDAGPYRRKVFKLFYVKIQAAAQQIQECRHQLNILNERERKKFRGMFDRLANEKQQNEEGNIGQKMEVA